METDLFMEVFDPARPVAIRWRRLPHWGQDGTITFITFRTLDSIPAPVLAGWLRERDSFLENNGIDPWSHDWREKLAQLPRPLRQRFHREFSDKWHRMLDDCHGERLLARPDIADIVARSLRHFDGQRYLLTDFVIMPTHVHLLASFADGDQMLEQCDSWKHFTAVRINKLFGRTGRFWQQDGFDHLVRSSAQFDYLRGYIADNPKMAGLREGEHLHYSKPM